ncbi:MAG: IS66 family insertion sequence element accessory protein TnpB [bacterium]|nr:IS66 family insertion sequence element accessory protein TnpB [bacterium]
MLQITPHQRLLLATTPADFRRGLDGLAGLCRTALNQDPFSGAVFAFRNKASTSVKLLVYDGSGFWLCQKRFSKGRLAWWPVSKETAVTIKASELILLLAQGNPTHAALPKDWRRIPLGCNGVGSG